MQTKNTIRISKFSKVAASKVSIFFKVSEDQQQKNGILKIIPFTTAKPNTR